MWPGILTLDFHKLVAGGNVPAVDKVGIAHQAGIFGLELKNLQPVFAADYVKVFVDCAGRKIFRVGNAVQIGGT